MKTRFVLFVAALALTSSLFAQTLAPSASPHWMQRDAIAVLRRAGVLRPRRHVESVFLLGDSWVVVVRYRDGALHNYSSDPLSETRGEICHHG